MGRIETKLEKEYTAAGHVRERNEGPTATHITGKRGFQKTKTTCTDAPVQETCPAGINIPRFQCLQYNQKYVEALRTILDKNPPSPCGRVCFHPCKPGCSRFGEDRDPSPVSQFRGIFMSRFMDAVCLPDAERADRVPPYQYVRQSQAKKHMETMASPLYPLFGNPP